MKLYDTDYSIGSPFCNIENHKSKDLKLSWKKGTYNFKNGTVLIYYQEKFLSLSFYINGRGFYRTIKGKNYTDIGIARKAGEFGRNIIENVS